MFSYASCKGRELTVIDQPLQAGFPCLLLDTTRTRFTEEGLPTTYWRLFGLNQSGHAARFPSFLPAKKRNVDE